MEFREGKVVIRVPEFEKITSKSQVFYNPYMEFDRRLSCEVFKASGKRKVCDAFSGSGIRAISYALEGGEVTACDVSLKATELIKENAELNKVSIRVMREDANILLRKEKFEVIDADPFGSPSVYLDSLMCGLRNDSLLFVTATDTEAVCGYAKKAALRKYGVKMGKTPFAKELGVRVLLTAIMREGAKHEMGVSVLLSYWRRHYIRVFVKVRQSKKAAFETMKKVNPVFFCRCGFFSEEMEEKCPLCENDVDCISPVYLGRIKENEFLAKVKNEMAEELIKEIDIPFYYDTHWLARFFGFQPPKIEALLEKLKEDFQASRTIFCPTGVKTDAPLDKVIEISSELK